MLHVTCHKIELPEKPFSNRRCYRTGGNVSDTKKVKREHRQIVVGENGQLTVFASYGFPVT